ncbi:MAG TPA: chemotaxis protein CheD [Clostridia bacterium]|nr:chemotaxis protein CheD [Clostridia bacterium]
MEKIVGLGDCAVSANPEEKIITHALASCVAVTAYSPWKKVAGMLHIVLPCTIQSQKDNASPYYYAVTGIPLMIDRMCGEYGCNRSELNIKLFGGADSIREKDVFKLGQKNKQMAEKVLTDMKLSFDASETGGVLSRTLEMDVASGVIIVRYQPITI